MCQLLEQQNSFVLPTDRICVFSVDCHDKINVIFLNDI
jgi:hypothetical protein